MRKFAYGLIPGFALLLLVASVCQAAPVTSYAVLSEQPDAAPKVGMRGDIRIRIDGDEPVEVTKMVLRLDGEALGVVPRWQPDERLLLFSLLRNDTNRSLWTRILRAPFSHDKVVSLPLTLEYANQLLRFKPGVGDAHESPVSAVKLVTYDTARIGLGILLVLIVVIFTVVLCKRTTMMQDGVFPQLQRQDRPYSLSRFQMIVWFCAIFTSFSFIFAVTGDLNSMTTEAFILLGISGATALGAVAVDQSKDSVVSQIQAALISMGLKDAADVKKMYVASLDKTKSANPANTIIPNASLPDNENPTIAEFWECYQNKISPVRSAGFLKDLVNDVNGATIHRWQVLIWTLVLAGIYVGSVYLNLEMPTLGNQLLALMGISGGVYVGLKIPERQV